MFEPELLEVGEFTVSHLLRDALRVSLHDSYFRHHPNFQGRHNSNISLNLGVKMLAFKHRHGVELGEDLLFDLLTLLECDHGLH